MCALICTHLCLLTSCICTHCTVPDNSKLKLRSDTQQSTFQELRLSKRLGDKDLRYHVGRIYLEGVNSPFHWLGGAWELPLHPPPHLKGLFVDEEEEGEEKDDDGNDDDDPDSDTTTEKNSHHNSSHSDCDSHSSSSKKNHVKWSSYAHFVGEVNAAVRWEMGGWEVCYYYFLLLLAPPRAERFLVSPPSLPTSLACVRPFCSCSQL